MDLKFKITKFADLLHGSQDHTINIVDNNIYICGGFCDGGGCPIKSPEELRNFLNKKTNHNRGFIKKYSNILY